VLAETDTEGRVIPVALTGEDGAIFDIIGSVMYRRAVIDEKAGEPDAIYLYERNKPVLFILRNPRWFCEAK